MWGVIETRRCSLGIDDGKVPADAAREGTDKHRGFISDRSARRPQLQDADFVEVSHVRIRKTMPFPANNRLIGWSEIALPHFDFLPINPPKKSSWNEVLKNRCSLNFIIFLFVSFFFLMRIAVIDSWSEIYVECEFNTCLVEYSWVKWSSYAAFNII